MTTYIGQKHRASDHTLRMRSLSHVVAGIHRLWLSKVTTNLAKGSLGSLRLGVLGS
tara:strand:- start:95 stop:262 length:168 start_codon:yes stop_codon:yes gene_type:complete